jgi:hypothetical protein
MSAPGRPKREFPLGGEGAQRQGGDMSAPGRPKREFPLGGKARSAKGAT